MDVVIGVILVVVSFALGWFVSLARSYVHFKFQERKVRADSVKKSRSVLTGKIAEVLAPYLPDFAFKATEVRFLGTPVDYVVFKGLDDDVVDEIVFLEVKSGEAVLSKREQALKDAVLKKRVRFEEYRVKL